MADRTAGQHFARDVGLRVDEVRHRLDGLEGAAVDQKVGRAAALVSDSRILKLYVPLSIWRLYSFQSCRTPFRKNGFIDVFIMP